MDLLTVLRYLETLESKMADLYAGFSKTFGQDGEAAAFFSGMSMEEIAHRDLVRYQHKLVRKNPDEFKGVDVDIGSLKKVIEEVEEVMYFPGDRSLKDAAIAAIGFENDAAEGHYRSAMEQSNPDVSRLLDSLSSSDRNHAARLSGFARSRGFLS